MPSLDDIYSFVINRQWSALVLVLVAVLCWFVVRLSKSDTAPSWFVVPSRWRPVLAIGLGAAAGAIYKAATSGVSWGQGLWLGLTAGVGAVLIQVIGVDVIRGGKEVPMPKSLSVRPPPPPPAAKGGPDETSRVDVPQFPKPPSSLLRALALAGTVLFYAASVAVSAAMFVLLPGCQQLHDVMPVIDQILVWVTDAEHILASLENIAQLFMAKAPADVQEKYALLDDRVHRALDAIVRLGRAGKALDSSDMAAAITEFQGAWTDLEGFLSAQGVHAGAMPGKIGATGPRDVPLLMTVHTMRAK